MSEFSRTVTLEDLAEGPRSYTLDPDKAVRAALAERFDLLALEGLVATVTARLEGRGIEVSGRFEASVVQRCVVTLDPVPARLEDAFTVVFLPEMVGAEDEPIDVTSETDYEPLAGDSVDVAEVVAQSLSLALEPYPRAAHAGERGEASMRDPREPDPEDDEERNPFAVLKKLRDES